jgi:hypothetical protein
MAADRNGQTGRRTLPLRIELHGELFAGHSFANINEQIALHLIADDRSICSRVDSIRPSCSA